MTSLPRQVQICIRLGLFALLGLAVVGCNFKGSLDSPVAVDPAADKTEPVEEVTLPFDQELLNYFWEGSNHNDWDVISGMVDPVTGGRLTGTPASWPSDKSYIFGLYFPPGALAGADSVEVSISIPRVNANEAYAPVFLLEPHGALFTTPVLVQFCYPPWLSPGDNYSKFCLKREIEEPTPWYTVTDFAKVLPSPDDKALELLFETTHFSRWGMQNGQGGDEGQEIDPDDSYPARIKR